MYKGSCLCGGVTYSVVGFSEGVSNCHCTMCRKFHGAAYGTLVSVEGLSWLSGQELLKEYQAQNRTVRTFCSECGSSIGFRAKGASKSEIELAISTFDDEVPCKIEAQIYTGYKASWCKLYKEIPVFKEGKA